jgi:hypothetical protein
MCVEHGAPSHQEEQEGIMSIVGFLETDLHFGTVNTSASTSKQQNFGAPLTVWSRPYLQQVSVNDDDGSVILWVSEYKNNMGAHSGKFVPGIYSEKCTSVTYAMFTRNCIATAVLTTEIFG